MKEIIDNVERILQNYNISLNELNRFPGKKFLSQASDPKRLQMLIEQRFHKQIGLKDAKELEILLLTYNYISHN
ncbi:MAG: hypothetical protein HC819_18830 [Cyclobacteriaceae bacterium]|nr:hypothetical protein [Cyclobacteriaceae bacterium]